MEEKEDILPDAEPEAENEAGCANEDVAEAEDNDIEETSEDADSEAEEEEDDDGVGTIPPIPKMARGFHISGRLMFQNEFTITKEIYL